MKSLYLCLIMSFFLFGCESTPEKQEAMADKRMRIAENLEQQGRWFDALIQWQILYTLYPEQQHISQEIDRLSQQIIKKKQFLKAQYAKIEKSDKTKAKKDILLGILAIAPNDPEAKEALRQMNWALALKSANAKTKTIVKYFEENQKKAQKSIELTNLLDQGEQFIKAGKYKALLQTADRLESKHPKHAKINHFRYTAYSQIGKQYQDNNDVETAIASYDRAAKYAPKNDDATLSRKILDLRQTKANEYYIEGKKLFKHDLEKAIELFKRAKAIFPEHPKVMGDLVRAERIQKNLLKIKNLKK
ncbi:hypothetical protein [Agaribacter marinus]|nr:hypothetical protein [Agaribacter marinus]